MTHLAEGCDISGEALPIFVEENGKFRLREENLKKILLREDVKDSHVMILSIAGALREGKSFILNFIIRYLRSSTKENWLGDETSSLLGFSWRGGLQRNTSGIMMWSEPFQINTADGKLSVLLMDTQGLFDEESDMNDIMTIFCMSFLLSSFQVYNVMKMIKDDTMQYFTTFLEYAKMAQTSDRRQCLLQRLMLLVRDWRDENAHNFGEKGGQEYMNEYLNARHSPNTSRTNLKSAADKLLCFLMPSPGQKVHDKRRDQEPFRGALKDIDRKFVESLSELMHTFFSPENIAPKSVKGQLLTGKGLIAYAKNLDEIFSGDELPKAERVCETVKTAFYEALREEFLTTFRKTMNELVKSPGKTENEFLEESRKILSRLLKEYDARPKYGGEDDIRRQKKMREELQREQEFYIQKLKTEREILRKKCCRLAEERCTFYESQLKKKFDGVCCKPEALAESLEVTTWKALYPLPDLVRNSAFDTSFRRTILEGMKKVANKLDKENDVLLRDMEATCREIKLQCENFVQDEMQKLIRQKVWTTNEVPRRKKDLETETSDYWDILTKKVNGPTELMSRHKWSLMIKTRELISHFETKNRQNKDQLDKEAEEEVIAVMEEYESLMMEEMGRKAHIRQDMERFHKKSCMESLKSPRLQRLRPYLKDKTTQLFHERIGGEFQKMLERNELTAETQRKHCYYVKSNCIKEAERLMEEYCGRQVLDDLYLQFYVKRTEKRIMQRFDSDCSTRIASVQSIPRRQLEQYLKLELPKIAAEKEKLNETLMEREVEAVTHLLQTESGLWFKKILGSSPFHQSILKIDDDFVRKKMNDIVDNKCTSETSKQRCREKMDQMLIDGREQWNTRRIEEERQRREKVLEIKSECLRIYRKGMEENMKYKIEDYHFSRLVIEMTHLGVLLSIGAVLHRHRHIVSDTVKKEIFQTVKENKEELLETARLMEQNIERTKSKLRNFYVTVMENKLGGHCCNESVWERYQQEAIESVNNMRKDTGVEFKMPTLYLLSTETVRFRDWNVLENEKFRERCDQSAKNIIDDYKALPAGIRERHVRDCALRNNEIQKRLRSFRWSLKQKGNSDTIEEYSALIKKELEELATRRNVSERDSFLFEGAVDRRKADAILATKLKEAEDSYMTSMEKYIQTVCCQDLRSMHSTLKTELLGRYANVSGVDQNGSAFSEFRKNVRRSLDQLFDKCQQTNSATKTNRHREYTRKVDDAFARYKLKVQQQWRDSDNRRWHIDGKIQNFEKHHRTIKSTSIDALKEQLPPAYCPPCSNCKAKYVQILENEIDDYKSRKISEIWAYPEGGFSHRSCKYGGKFFYSDLDQ